MDVATSWHLQNISEKDGFIPRKGCQASRVTLLEALVQTKCYQGSPARAQTHVLRQALEGLPRMLCEAPSYQKLRLVSGHPPIKTEDFIPGWSTTLDTAREVGTKGERGGWWTECFRGSVCGLATSLKLNGALLMGSECLKSPEAFVEC